MPGISRTRLVLAALLGVPAMFAGCRCQSCSRKHPAGSASPSARSSASAPPKRKRSTHLHPLPGPAEQRLAAGGADVQAPVGATDSRPVLIVLSGANPEAACRTWRGVSRGYGFVLCPGIGSDEGGAPPDIPSTEKRLRAALHEIRRRFGDYISPGPVVLVGIGGSARLAPWLTKQEPAYFARIALVDGGFKEWSSGLATIFATRGGKRAAFVCTRPGCGAPAEDAAVLTRRAGAQARSVQPGDAGVDEAGVFAWLIEGDADWKPPPAAASK